MRPGHRSPQWGGGGGGGGSQSGAGLPRQPPSRVCPGPCRWGGGGGGGLGGWGGRDGRGWGGPPEPLRARRLRACQHTTPSMSAPRALSPEEQNTKKAQPSKHKSPPQKPHLTHSRSTPKAPPPTPQHTASHPQTKHQPSPRTDIPTAKRKRHQPPQQATDNTPTANKTPRRTELPPPATKPTAPAAAQNEQTATTRTTGRPATTPPPNCQPHARDQNPSTRPHQRHDPRHKAPPPARITKPANDGQNKQITTHGQAHAPTRRKTIPPTPAQK
jgi:hypothetical protein